MQGIYIIKNIINDKVYIGQSVDIHQRWLTHYGLGKIDANPKRLEFNNQIHSAMRELGRENFYVEVLEECSKELLNEREIFWIKYYNSYKNGYNGTEGGDFERSDISGEKNGRAILSKEDVIYIRECYNNHIQFKEVFKIYSDKISKRGLQNVWWFRTWKDIHLEYHTEENKLWHRTQAKSNSTEIAKNNKRCFTKEEVIKMRLLFEQGLSVTEIWKTLYPDKSKSTVYNIVHKITYKDIH